jgi:hypothetical protein
VPEKLPLLLRTALDGRGTRSLGRVEYSREEGKATRVMGLQWQTNEF